jgi:hypothetical protein
MRLYCSLAQAVLHTALAHQQLGNIANARKTAGENRGRPLRTLSKDHQHPPLQVNRSRIADALPTT